LKLSAFKSRTTHSRVVSFDNPEEHLEIAEKLKIGGEEVFDPNEIDTGDKMRIINDTYGIQWHLYVNS